MGSGRSQIDGCLGRRLTPQRGFECRHGLANGARIARRIGRFKRFGRVKHNAVALAQGRIGLFTFGGFAVKGLVNRFAKSVPQFLFVAPLQWHDPCLSLPAQLQGLDRINAQLGLGTQYPGLFNQSLTRHQATLLYGFQRRGSSADGGGPKWLQLGKYFFTHIAALAPAFAKLVQQAAKALPVIVERHRVGGSPGVDLVNQGQTLRPVLGRLGLDLFQPGLDDFMRLVAGIIKTLPKCVIGHTALVRLLPLLAQGAQMLLHLAPAHRLTLGSSEQTLGLDHQLFTQLVGSPTLPALELTGCSERGVGLVFEFVIDDLAIFLERVAQSTGCTGARLAMSFGNFLFQF